MKTFIIALIGSLVLSGGASAQTCGNPHYVKQEDGTLKFSCESTRLPKLLFGIAWLAPAAGDVITTDVGNGREVNIFLPLWVEKSWVTTTASNAMMMGMAGIGAQKSYWLWTHDQKKLAVAVTVGIVVLHGIVIRNNLRFVQ